MRRSRFTAEQIVVALKQAEAGVPVKELCRKYEISEKTFYGWRQKYGGLQASELHELRHLRIVVISSEPSWPDEIPVKIGPQRIEARILLAAQGGSGVAQVYRAG